MIQAKPDEIDRLMQHWGQTLTPSKNAYIQALLKPAGATISIYTSGKVMFQGEQAEGYAKAAGFEVATQAPRQAGQDFPMIGTDEVGNGSYFGGLAVVASYVTPTDHAWLKQLGIDDSKKMTDARIRQLAPQLKEKIPHQALLLSPKKYNQVIEEGYNAVSVKVALHNQAIFLLLQKGVQPQDIIIDAFTTPKNYQKYVQKETNQVSQAVHLIEKAEGQYLAVAVSSIIARALFLDNLEQLGAEMGYTLPSGAGSASDQVAAKILATYGMPGLQQTAKLHFANTKKAQALAHRK